MQEQNTEDKSEIIRDNFNIETDEEKTKGIFSISKDEQTVKLENNEEKKSLIPEKFIDFISKTGVICSAILAFLSLFSGNNIRSITFFSLYALCFAQCICKFKNKTFNVIFILVMLAYNIFTIAGNFYLFDYTFLILALSLLAITTTKTERKLYKNMLCLVLIICALTIFKLLLGVSTETHYAYVFGMAAVPVLMFLTSLIIVLLSWKLIVGISLLGVLHFFPFIVYLAYILFIRLSLKESFIFYIANANFIGLSQEIFSWWHYGRFLGFLVQTFAIISLSALNIIVEIPEKCAKIFQANT